VNQKSKKNQSETIKQTKNYYFMTNKQEPEVSSNSQPNSEVFSELHSSLDSGDESVGSCSELKTNHPIFSANVTIEAENIESIAPGIIQNMTTFVVEIASSIVTFVISFIPEPEE
jgi:hypothetical protein